jgi:hypothetical protein
MIRFSGIVFCHHSSLNSPGRLGEIPEIAGWFRRGEWSRNGRSGCCRIGRYLSVDSFGAFSHCADIFDEYRDSKSPEDCIRGTLIISTFLMVSSVMV